MSKPIWFVKLTVKYRKSIFIFTFPTTANNKDEITDSDQYYIAKKVMNSSKKLRDKYKDIFTDCIIIDFEKIKQIGKTRN